MKSENELFKIAEKIYYQCSASRYPEAILAFKNLLNKYPNHIKGWSMLSTMQLYAKNYDDAIDSIENAIKLDPNNVSLWNHKQILLVKINTFELKEFKIIDPETGLEYEIKHFKNKNELLQEILSSCNKQIMNVPKDYYNLGNLFEKKGRIFESLEEWENAIEAFKSAIIFHEEYSDKDFYKPIYDCYLKIAKIYELQNKLLLAVEYYDKSFIIKNEEIILTHKARVLKKMGDDLTSKTVLNKFIEIVKDKFENTKNSAYMFQLIRVYKENDQIDKAFETLEEMEPKTNKYDGIEESILALKSELLQSKN